MSIWSDSGVLHPDGCVYELTEKGMAAVDRSFYMGIDPGLDGGLVVITRGNTTPVEAVRLSDLYKDDNYPDKLMRILEKYSNGTRRVALENLATGHPGDRGVNSAKTMGVNWGVILGALHAFRYDIETPLAVTWQNGVLGARRDRSVEDLDPKVASVRFAKFALPGLNLRPGKTRTDHDGLADAACLAWWALMADIKKDLIYE